MVRRYGPAREIYDRLVAASRLPSRAILNEARFLLNTPLRRSKFSAYRVASGSNPADLFKWHGDDSDLEFAQDTSIRKLQVMAARFAQL